MYRSEVKSEISADLKTCRMFDLPLLSDVKICFGTRKIHAHKMVLTMASEYFESAFTGKVFVSGKSAHVNFNAAQTIDCYIHDRRRIRMNLNFARTMQTPWKACCATFTATIRPRGAKVLPTSITRWKSLLSLENISWRIFCKSQWRRKGEDQERACGLPATSVRHL